MTNQAPPKEIDPEVFRNFAGPEAVYVIIVKSNNEHENVIPIGTEYEIGPIPDPKKQIDPRSSQYYKECRNGKLFCCCGNFCVRCGNC